MMKDKLVGVKMSDEMFGFLSNFAQEDDLTVPGVIRKIIKKVMDVFQD